VNARRPTVVVKKRRSPAPKAAPKPKPVPTPTPPPPAAEFDGRSIVDRAKSMLRSAGYDSRAINLMTLDGIMREANRMLKAANVPQLGRKAEWLWP
jgi:hypothetical protein